MIFLWEVKRHGRAVDPGDDVHESEVGCEYIFEYWIE